MSTLFKRLWQTLQDKEYRHAYAEGFSDSKIATQIKVLREQRGWTQQQLAEAAGMKQSRIAVLEDVNYSSWSIRTLRRLAQALDLWLDVEFKEFGTVWSGLRDFSREALTRCSFADDPIFKQGEAVFAIGEIPTNLQEKALGKDRKQSENLPQLLIASMNNNVLRFPMERISRTQDDARGEIFNAAFGNYSS